MNGNEDKKRFSVVMYWLASVMKDQGGKKKLLTIPADAETRTPEVNVQRDYYEALNDIRIERIEWAAKHIFKTGTWFPMPKEIREAAMLAPSSVLAALPNNQVLIPEFTEEQRAEASKVFDDIINRFEEWGKV